MSELRLYGAAYSVYVRIVRMTLAEKDVAYCLVPVDIFADSGVPDDYRRKHPFGKIPFFQHGDFELFETGAITRYIDGAFPDPPLMPSDSRMRARADQLISIVDNYAYPSLVWGVYVERVSKPREGALPDEAKIAASLEKARVCLQAIEALTEDNAFLLGDTPCLADLYLAPMIDYFVQAPEGEALLKEHSRLAAWWTRMAARPSMTATRP